MSEKKVEYFPCHRASCKFGGVTSSGNSCKAPFGTVPPIKDRWKHSLKYLAWRPSVRKILVLSCFRVTYALHSHKSRHQRPLGCRRLFYCRGETKSVSAGPVFTFLSVSSRRGGCQDDTLTRLKRSVWFRVSSLRNLTVCKREC